MRRLFPNVRKLTILAIFVVFLVAPAHAHLAEVPDQYDIPAEAMLAGICVGTEEECLLTASPANRGTPFVPLAKTSGGPVSDLYNTGSLPDFINGLFRFAIIIGAIAAVLRIAYAGYLYMGQSDMWSHKGEAKAILGDVTLGLLLLLSIYIILYQINPDILNLDPLRNITPEPASGGGGGGGGGSGW